MKLFVGKTRPRLWASIASGQVYIDRTQAGPHKFHPRFPSVQSAPLATRDKPVKLRLFVDSCSVEVFVNDGEQVLTA